MLVGVEFFGFGFSISVKAVSLNLSPTFAAIVFIHLTLVASLCVMLFVGIAPCFGQPWKNSCHPIEASPSIFTLTWLQFTFMGFWAAIHASLVSWAWISWRVLFLTMNSNIFAAFSVIITQFVLIYMYSMVRDASQCWIFLASMDLGPTAW